MNNTNLSEMQIVEIKTCARNLRNKFGALSSEVPLGRNLRMLIEQNDIVICEYPFKQSIGSHTDAAITVFETDKGDVTFIGLNTSLYYDEQLFCLAHELFHYCTHTGMAYEHEKEEETEDIECMADRFAAELLLPAETFERLVITHFLKKSVDGVADLKLFRFIAKIQSEWMLPYQAIIRRFYEESYISEQRFQELYNIDVRNMDNAYYKILYSMDAEACELLNRRSQTHTISNTIYEMILNNFEEGNIREDELVESLEILGKKPEDFGIEIIIEDSDADMDFLFSEGE